MLIKRENQVLQKATAHHLPTNVRALFPNPDRLPSLHTGQDVLWCGTFLWSIQVTCARCAPPQFLLVSPRCQNMRQWKNVFDLR